MTHTPDAPGMPFPARARATDADPRTVTAVWPRVAGW
jgi:hypothetical protein